MNSNFSKKEIEELNIKLDKVFENTFYYLRKILNDQTSLLKKINKNYEETLKNYLKSYVGPEYYNVIFTIYDCIVDIISCVDLYKLTSIILKYNITPFDQIDTRKIVFDSIDKIQLGTKEKAFIKNLIDVKLNIIFECVDFILKNPKITLKAVQALTFEQEDIF